MRYRTFGRLGWEISEVGYGMWGIAGGSGGFTDANYDTAPQCLERALELGCNFFDTASSYGGGLSEQMLGRLLREHADRRIYVATKIAPKNREWPPRPGDTLDDVFPPDYIRESVYKSLENMGVSRIDLMQFHVWEDRWAADERWQTAMAELKREGVIEGIGISVNRWEPANCLRAIDSGLIDAIQVIYNVFDQSPEDELFARARKENIGIIARVPFDEGGLTGTLSAGHDVSRGRLAQHLLRPREPAPDRAARRRAQANSAGRHDAARADAALHPARPGGEHGDPRDAPAAPRRGEHRGERRARAPGRPDGRAAPPPLGPHPDGVVGLTR